MKVAKQTTGEAAPAASSEKSRAAAQGDAPPLPQPDGIRDTIESIVVAFILAFVFRAFVVEAFVIPTGSMAPGLYGMHAHHRCDACGYAWAFGLRGDIVVGDRVSRGTLSDEFTVKCPNCTWDGRGNANLNRPTDPVIPDAGDRILVLKWPYDIGGAFLGPQRWDVVVFKDPQDAEQNFIKRLIGLPGEVLEIINGDIYAADIDDLPDDLIAALERDPAELKSDRSPLTEDQRARLNDALRIQRKTDMAQSSLWILHYDHDFMPDPERVRRYPGFDPPAWTPKGEGARRAWDASTPVLRFTPEDDGTYWLNLTGQAIQDDYGYNNVVRRSPIQSNVNVSDAMISFVAMPGGGAGRLTLQISRGSDVFQALLDSDGQVTLQRLGKGGIPIVFRKGKMRPMTPGKPFNVEFENLDYRVALRIDGQEIAATDEAQYAPNIEAILGRHPKTRDAATIAMAASQMAMELRHVRVHRDVYYRSDAALDASNALTNRQNPLAGFHGWGTEGNPILLPDDPPVFFCCGDNSPQSKDSRMWWEVAPLLIERGQIDPHLRYRYGTVPGDQMIGRAFFVYWPSGFRFSEGTPAVIPNVGRMRIIR